MKSEEEIKKYIEKIKDDILMDVLLDLDTNQSLQQYKNWIKALEWVLREDNQ